MNVASRRYRPPVALLIIAFLCFFVILVLDVESVVSDERSEFVPLRADARLACAVAVVVGVLWLVVLRSWERNDARQAAGWDQLERAVHRALVDANANANTGPIPRLHVVRGTAAVVSPMETIDPNTVTLLRRLDSELRGDDQQ